MKMQVLLQLPLLLLLMSPALAAITQIGTTCTVTPLSSDTTSSTADDTPQILTAFKSCGKDGSITFEDGTYHINQIMDITLSNSTVILRGTWIWSTDIQYWLSHSISVVYAGRSTAWRIGGENFNILGQGVVFDGNGQKWYDQNKNAGNQNGRPISFTLWNARNAVVDGITWRQVQFW
jgi:galacturan 1,4-alpha-galacturonidase